MSPMSDKLQFVVQLIRLNFILLVSRLFVTLQMLVGGRIDKLKLIGHCF